MLAYHKDFFTKLNFIQSIDRLLNSIQFKNLFLNEFRNI
jgi:hypothetical protein